MLNDALPNEMSTEDALDTNKNIFQDDVFVFIGSTDKGTNGNRNNDRDFSLGVPKQLHSSTRNGCGSNAGNFGYAECTENSSQATMECQPPCRPPLAKQLPNRDFISQVVAPETQNTYNSASKIIDHSGQLPLYYNDSANTLSYLQTKKRSLSHGPDSPDWVRRVKRRSRPSSAPLEGEVGMENESGGILSALSPTLSMSAILLQPNSINQVFGDATLGEYDQTNSVHVATKVCGLEMAELSANTTHDNGEEGTNIEQHEYRPRRSSHARRRPLRFSSASPSPKHSSYCGHVTADKNRNSSGVSRMPHPTEISTSLADCISDADKSACDLDAGYREWRLEAFLKYIQIGSRSTYSIEFGVDSSHPLASSLHSQLVLPRNLHSNPPIDEETMQSIDSSNAIERPSTCNMPKQSKSSIDGASQRRSRARKRSSTISIIAKKQLAAPPKRGGRKRKKPNR